MRKAARPCVFQVSVLHPNDLNDHTAGVSLAWVVEYIVTERRVMPCRNLNQTAPFGRS